MTESERIKRTFDQHKIEKVKVGGFDVDGILRGKYVSREKCLSAIEGGLGFCDVIFGWDSGDVLYDHDAVTGWNTGFPDAVARIDLSTFCLLPWEPSTAFFLLDFCRADGTPLGASPRTVLRRVIERAESMKYSVRAAIEFEYWFFREDPHSARAKRFSRLTPLSPGMFGYSVLRASVDSELSHAILDGVKHLGIELEGHHTETGPGVYESAIRADSAVRAADKAALFKTAVKIIAQKRGLLATFMAKWNPHLPGSSGHVHQSLADLPGARNLFYQRPKVGKSDSSMSLLMQRYIAGQLALMPEFAILFQPTINSYKRTAPGTRSWAPANVTWGLDNRTTAVRAIVSGPKATRVEHRLAGADANPYLSLAASVASGLHGIEAGLEIPAATSNAYASDAAPLPRSLKEANAWFRASEAARNWFGDEFVEFFSMTRDWEVRQFERAVTDWELERYFESI
jgi:glutamine synthetase